MSFGYNASYEETCLTYAAREQASWDFVICEANKGWPAAHITLPLMTYVFIQDFWMAWCLPGLFEAFEVATLVFFGDFIIFDTLDVERETLAGALLGDWIINGTLGIIIGMLLVRAIQLPPFIPWKRLESISDSFSVTQPHIVHGLMMKWRYWGMWFLFVLNNVLIGWVLPADCLDHVPRDCTNIGLILSTIGQAILLMMLHYLHRDDPLIWFPSPSSSSSPPVTSPTYRARQQWPLVLLWFIIATIHLQNAQPYIPYYLGIASGFIQPWFVSLLWILLLGMACMHDYAEGILHWLDLHGRQPIRRLFHWKVVYGTCTWWACCRGRRQRWPSDLQ